MKQFFISLVLISALAGCSPGTKSSGIEILVFTKTNDYRHESIPAGIDALKIIAGDKGWGMFTTEDSTYFTEGNLKKYEVIIFLLTSGDILGEEEQNSIQKSVESGTGLLAIHGGTFTEETWPWFSNAIGGHFIGHPPVQKATLMIEDRQHPTTKCFPADTWEAVDEWYSFDRNPRDNENIQVLISIDESSYDVDDNQWFEGVEQRMGDHPMVWYCNAGKGIVYHSGFGHTGEMYESPVYLEHIESVIEWLGIQNSVKD